MIGTDMASPLLRKTLAAMLPLLIVAAVLELTARMLLAPGELPAAGGRGDQFRDFIRVDLAPEAADALLRFDADLFWALEPSSPALDPAQESALWVDTATNALGLRDDEIVTSKRKGIVRVLCVGDSCTYGSGVRRRDAYPQVLQRLLGPRVEVINAGVPGYTAYQAARWLERDGMALEPDVVVFATGFNEGRSWDGRTDEEHRGRLEPAGGLDELLRHSRFVQWLASRLQDGRDDGEGPPRERGDVRRLPVPRYAHWLEQAEAIAASGGARLMHLMWPRRDNLTQDDPALGGHQDALLRRCRRLGLPLVDPAPALRPLGVEATMLDGIHMTPAGNAIVAGEVGRQLRRLDWLP